MVLRISLLLTIPNLSDDLYRYLWDGILNNQQVNPFTYLPSYWMELTERPDFIHSELYKQMNSANYFTIYPPICQAWFSFGALGYGLGGIQMGAVFMRLVAILCEAGTIFFIYKTLKLLKKDTQLLKLYLFNPLLIIELTANIHPESLMLFGMSGAVYFLLKKKYTISTLFMIWAVNAKLLPLMFLPLLFNLIGWKESLKYYVTVGVGTIILFVPFMDMQTLQNFSQSLDLYFQRFEFNASVYYIVRWIGFQVKGFNIIQVAGPVLSLITVATIAFLGLRKKQNENTFLNYCMIAFSVYLFMSPIVHPWYLSILIFFTTLSHRKYILWWSFSVIFSYSAYQWNDYHENMLLISIEYLLVFFFLFQEKSTIFGNNSLKRLLRYKFSKK